MSNTPQSAAPAPADVQPPAPTHASPGGNPLGVTALVLGIVGLVLALLPIVGFFGGFIGFVGLVLGIIALVLKNKKRGAAITGTILSGLALVLSIVMGVVYAAAFVAAVDDSLEVTVNGEVVEGFADDEVEEEAPAVSTEPGAAGNPLPFGSTVVVNDEDGPAWEVAVGAPTVDVTADVLAASDFNTEPAPGRQFASLPVTATYVGSGEAPPAELVFTFIAPDGLEWFDSYVLYDGLLMEMDAVSTGETVSGVVIIEIPTEGAGDGPWGTGYIYGDIAWYFGDV
ncbi:hypothetical protein ARHIZOSPH14_07550 [Agromyces rhizosphaerae]|uniref:DUF4190 domain-containing protein n=1 Tax=Agromyces rhizosphaerae TaxID=88374 RepID=A0A9W6CZ46_9MICO|nr:DUF4190 domain-containing protein [Agromyces rhizosphaerae]GLI26513.1 hypothetical protein ARHIZOSPH14_07550 [Agromyces rhizosphaerae]